jgi:predicted DNA-binding antitoxin AbrB/MazE fold protein
MTQIVQATYQNGYLRLNQKLKNVSEGQTLTVMVLETGKTAFNKARFLSFVARYTFKLPADYHFDRDEIYAR